MGRVREEKRREEERESLKERRSRCAKRQESRETRCFKMICGSGGSKNRLAKAAGAEQAGQMRDEKVHAVVARSTFRSQNVQNTRGSVHFWKLQKVHAVVARSREAHVGVKMYKTHHCRTTFGSCAIEKVHVVVARSTCRSQNVQSNSALEHL